jgi:hypothetical protein
MLARYNSDEKKAGALAGTEQRQTNNCKKACEIGLY